MQHQQLIAGFIEQIWNQRNLEKLDAFIHADFVDHSLPPSLTSDKEGLKKWIVATSVSFEHKTIIEDQVTENDKSVIKIRMLLKHIGNWRDIEATGLEVSTSGYRFYKIKDDKISESWALIDGQGLENQLKKASHGCKIAQ